MKKTELKIQYTNIVAEYVERFRKKHHLNDPEIVIENTIFEMSDYYFKISDIIEDINNNYPKGLILDWSNDCVEFAPEKINLGSYAMGLRFQYLIEQEKKKAEKEQMERTDKITKSLEQTFLDEFFP